MDLKILGYRQLEWMYACRAYFVEKLVLD